MKGRFPRIKFPEMDVTESLLYLSVGIEDLGDIIADFAQALG